MDFQVLRLLIGKRTWEVLLLPGGAAPEQLADALARAPGRPDLVLVPDPRAEAQAAWAEAARAQFGDDGQAALLADPDVARWGLGPAASLLALGRGRFVGRFCGEAAPGSSALRPTAGPRRTPRLEGALEPAGCPPFPEAEHLDPFALDPGRRRAAWDRASALLGRLAREAHRRGAAVTWPAFDLWGLADPDYRPWQSVAALDGGAPPAACPVAAERGGPPFAEDETGEALLGAYLRWMKAAHQARSLQGAHGAEGGRESAPGARRAAVPPYRPSRGRELPLVLLQRLLLSLHVGSGASPPAPDCWSLAAELLEELGYLAVSCGYVLSFPGGLKKFLDGGILLARIHEEAGRGYGDMHLGNFGYLDDLPFIVDEGGYYPFASGGTAAERAADLAVFRLECDFLRWQAACLGYRLAAPDKAGAVLAEFPDPPARAGEATP